MNPEPDTSSYRLGDTIAAGVNADDRLYADLERVAQLLSQAPAYPTGPSLLFRSREGTVCRIAIEDELLCGRAPNCNLRFPHMREISRRHFSISRSEDAYWLVDHGSFNGTKIRGRPVERHELCDGDLIDAGGFILAFVKE